MKILIVEDDPNLSLLWDSIFAATGHKVTAVHSAIEARQALLVLQFDLAVIDCYLGKEASLSLAALAAQSNPGCRIVLVTGASLRPRHELYEHSPAICAVLCKPVDIEHLVAVCDHIESSRPGGHPPSPLLQVMGKGVPRSA